jgi:hypothetical protein
MNSAKNALRLEPSIDLIGIMFSKYDNNTHLSPLEILLRFFLLLPHFLEDSYNRAIKLK